MKVVVHIISSDSWSGRKLESTKVYKSVGRANAFIKRFNSKNNSSQTPGYYEIARIHSIDGVEVT